MRLLPFCWEGPRLQPKQQARCTKAATVTRWRSFNSKQVCIGLGAILPRDLRMRKHQSTRGAPWKIVGARQSAQIGLLREKMTKFQPLRRRLKKVGVMGSRNQLWRSCTSPESWKNATSIRFGLAQHVWHISRPFNYTYLTDSGPFIICRHQCVLQYIDAEQCLKKRGIVETQHVCY